MVLLLVVVVTMTLKLIRAEGKRGEGSNHIFY